MVYYNIISTLREREKDMQMVIVGLFVIVFILGVGFLIGYATGKYVGIEKGTLDEANRWKSSNEWQVKRAEKHE